MISWVYRYMIARDLLNLDGASMTYRKESLGRMATFLLPSLKLKKRDADGHTIEEIVHQFLVSNFEGYTAAGGIIFGFWKDEKGEVAYGEHKEYKVAFIGKDRIAVLESFLATIAKEIGEYCIYFETGEDSWLIYPK